MLTVASYMKVIPPGNSNPEKPALLKNYIQGVNVVGDKGVIVNTFHPMDTDVAVIQGFVHANSKQTPHLKLRRLIYENQMKRNICVDMSCSIIHNGHVRLLKKASKFGKVYVALTSDEDIKKYKNLIPELNFKQRKEILQSIKYVFKVIKSKF